MSILVWILFRRWRTRAYFVVTIVNVVMAILHLVFFFISNFGSTTAQLNVYSLLTIYSALLLTGQFQFMQSRRKKEILQLSIGSTVMITISIFSALGIGFLQILSPVIGIVFVGLFLYRFVPMLPRKLLFYIAGGISAFSLIMQLIFHLMGSNLLLTLAMIGQSAFYILICFIFFSRVVDLIQVASQQSVMDGLTGLYNKTFFIDKVRTAFNTNEKATIIFADIDNFKMINDTQGHLVGDQILKVIGTVWIEVTQDIGIAARYGGEEMAALITDHRVDPERIAEKIRSRVEHVTKKIHPCTMSIGFAKNGIETESAEVFIRNADEAQYAAKKSGKNKVVEFGSELFHQFVLSQEIKEASNEVAVVEFEVQETTAIPEGHSLLVQVPFTFENNSDLTQPSLENEAIDEKQATIEVKKVEELNEIEHPDEGSDLNCDDVLIEEVKEGISTEEKKFINPFKKQTL